jgi:hypothetical protein
MNHDKVHISNWVVPDSHVCDSDDDLPHTFANSEFGKAYCVLVCLPIYWVVCLSSACVPNVEGLGFAESCSTIDC